MRSYGNTKKLITVQEQNEGCSLRLITKWINHERSATANPFSQLQQGLISGWSNLETFFAGSHRRISFFPII